MKLNTNNINQYLLNAGICLQQDLESTQVEVKFAKNFNLLVSLVGDRKLLVKQERHIQEGKTAGEFLSEWRITQFIKNFPELSFICSILPELVHFDGDNSILVFNYLTDYHDLDEFYAHAKVFPTAITSVLGQTLAMLHKSTLGHREYQEFFMQNRDASLTKPMFMGIERIEPEIFGIVPTEGLKFFSLYQRYDSLGKAIAKLATAFQPCCLTHNDLKLNNILLHNNWETLATQPSKTIIRLIDWERSGWGDPAFDLGMLIASYLQIWLNSLVISKSISIEESLGLAIIPLENIQPAIAALTKSYLSNFPEILEHRPDFLQSVVQFAGFALIQQIQAAIQYQKSFGNTGICMLQVAKSLLCRPEQSIGTVFGMTESQLTYLSYFPA